MSPWALAAALAAAAGIAGCASGRAVPQPFPGGPKPPVSQPVATAPGIDTPGEPAPTVGNSATPGVSLLLDTALSLRGVPYRNGGSDLAGFDCSGFVQYVFHQHGRNLPRETRDQFDIGVPVTTDDLRPGDLVFFETVRSGASHVGIALDREWFVHAPSSNGVVRVERYSSRYWTTRYLGARRIE